MMRMLLAQEARFRDGFVRYGQQGKAIPPDSFINARSDSTNVYVGNNKSGVTVI